MIVSVQHLTKRFGSVLAVDDLSFDVLPGRVTGFLGPNGAGKTTSLRMMLGLVTPTGGTATIDGVPYAHLPEPQRAVGAVLESSDFHPGRTARNHLRVQASTARVPDSRVDEVLALVGLTEAAGRRVGGFSLGMRQRLGLAGALLADPTVLLLDEPANGLDPEGIAWLRGLLRHLAAEGRTVLVSSHVLSEFEQTVDDVVIIARGRLVHASSLAELEALAEPSVRVTSPDAEGLQRLITEAGWADRAEPAATGHKGVAVIHRITAPEIGARAFAAGLELHELVPRDVGLEDIFLRLVGEDVGAQVAEPHLEGGVSR